MHKSLHILILLVCSVVAHAQEFGPPLGSLSPEEVQLVQAYRRDPEPF